MRSISFHVTMRIDYDRCYISTHEFVDFSVHQLRPRHLDDLDEYISNPAASYLVIEQR